MRQQFPFYKSFDDVAEDLTDAQLAKYIRVLLDVQFLRVKIDEVSFKDKMLNMAWKSQKHSIKKSINGFLDGQKRDTIKNPYFGAYVVPSEGIHEGIQTPDLEVQCKEEVKEQGKGKCKGEVKEELTDVTIIPEKSLSEKTIDYLNLKANKKFTYTKGNLKEINAQIKKGHTEQDLAHVIDVKVQEWLNNDDMKKNLNPVTLFREANFDRYLNQEMSKSGSDDVAYMLENNIFDMIDQMEDEVKGEICE